VDLGSQFRMFPSLGVLKERTRKIMRKRLTNFMSIEAGILTISGILSVILSDSYL
jgi:hypothetical protein